MSNNQCQHEYLQSGGGVPRNCIHCGEPEFTLGQKSKTIMTNQSAAEEVSDEEISEWARSGAVLSPSDGKEGTESR